jgi:hypothetical protein
LLIRWTTSESKDYFGHPLYLLLATISFFSVPLLGVIGLILGDSEFERIAESYEPYILPIISAAMLFVLYSAWTAAKALVILEETGAADRAVRWERTVKTLIALWIWPFGVWWVQKRVLAAVS